MGFKNLPGFGTVEESIPTEQNIIEITFTSTGSHCCTVESYAPTIPATNPYTVKNCKLEMFHITQNENTSNMGCKEIFAGVKLENFTRKYLI